MLDKICKVYYTKNAKHTLLKCASGGARPGRAAAGGETEAKPNAYQHSAAAQGAQIEPAGAGRCRGVTRQTITSIEVGRYTASLELAYKIARYFGLTIEEVFDFSELEE